MKKGLLSHIRCPSVEIFEIVEAQCDVKVSFLSIHVIPIIIS